MARLASWREPARAARIAFWLWIVLALAVWNVVFDQVIVMKGRQFLRAATEAAHAGGPYARLDRWMGPAVTTAFWTASASASAILIVGLPAVRFARARGLRPVEKTPAVATP